MNLGDHWFAPYYLDGGVGGSAFTTQQLLALGYRMNKYSAVELGYRNLAYYTNGLLQDIRFGGPMLGVTLRF